MPRRVAHGLCALLVAYGPAAVAHGARLPVHPHRHAARHPQPTATVAAAAAALRGREEAPAAALAYEALPYVAAADARAVVAAGDGRARFTVLSPHLLRIEYNPASAFEDRATLFAVDRSSTAGVQAGFTHTTTANGTLLIDTGAVRLEYRLGSESFEGGALTASGDGFESWQFGDSQADHNLGGTIKSLDLLDSPKLDCEELANVTVNDESLHCAYGVLSTKGWALLDDTGAPALEARSGWWAPRVGNQTEEVDAYLFAHGATAEGFAAALRELRQLSGAPAMPPRSALGVWFTRWFDYTDEGALWVADEYARRGLPLDTFVLDMNWHAKPHWGAYTFDARLMPRPEVALGALRARGLAVGANVHDDDGIRADEVAYEQACRAMGRDPFTGEDISFGVGFDNRTYAEGALGDAVEGALQGAGVDFLWVDFQQGGTEGHTEGNQMNPTAILNKLRATRAARVARKAGNASEARGAAEERGMVLGRFGGLGGHRYGVGFSGDVAHVAWASLAYQPYFTATSANVLFGLWSHDIVGPSAADFGGDVQAAAELHVRWVQWGVHSPVMRAHDRGMSAGGCADAMGFPRPDGSCAEVEVWRRPARHFEAMATALRRRGELVPYLATAQRLTFEGQIAAAVRPMYHEFADEAQAFAALTPDGEGTSFLFGADMVVAPVVRPASADTSGLTQSTMWVPPGLWYDLRSGRLLEGPTNVQSLYALDETPALARAGSVVATRARGCAWASASPALRAAAPYGQLALTFYPSGEGDNVSAAGEWYEDDGRSLAYTAPDGHAWYSAAMQSADHQLDATVELARGNATAGAASAGAARSIELRFPQAPAAAAVSVTVSGDGDDGALTTTIKADFATYAVCDPAVTAAVAAGEPRAMWWWDGQEVALVVRVVGVHWGETLRVSAALADGGGDASLSGVAGALASARRAKAALDEARVTPGAHSAPPDGALMALAGMGAHLAAEAGDSLGGFAALARGFWDGHKAAVSEVTAAATEGDVRWEYARALLMRDDVVRTGGVS